MFFLRQTKLRQDPVVDEHSSVDAQVKDIHEDQRESDE